nr:choice-of-anchor M domain-containing protein [Corynebacterium lactis]
MKKAIAAAGSALIAASTALVGVPSALAAPYVEMPGKIGELTPSGHKKGYPTFKQKVILDEELEDTNTGGTHVCAGRKLIYQGHADPIYGTYDRSAPEGKQLTSMFVDGQDVVPADTVCARLAPDASEGDSSTGAQPGDQVSKMVVPDDPAYSFLGEPGQVVWHAPQLIEWSQRPIYAGIGAFDPSHEADGGVPNDFADGLLHFDITGFEGPGRMSIFYNEGAEPHEIVSVEPGDTIGGEPGENKSFSRNVGAHGHYGWAFTEPGIYRITVTTWGDKTDGTREVGTPAELIWLVGSDSQVGLPDGTTTGLREVTNDFGVAGKETESADGTDSADSAAAPNNSAPTSTPAKSAKPGTPTRQSTPSAPGAEPSESEKRREQTPPRREPKPEQESATWWAGQHKPHIIRSGHMDMALTDVDGNRYALLLDDENPDQRVTRLSGTFAFALSDAATAQTLPTAWAEPFGAVPGHGYYVPMSNTKLSEAPWLGFSTEHVDYETLKPDAPVRLSITEFSGPGAMISGHETIGGATIALDSRDLSRTYDYPGRSHDHQFFWFTREGVYRTTFRYEWTNPDGAVQYQDLEAYFLVGDRAISAAENNSKPEDTSEADIDEGSMVCSPGGQDCPPAAAEGDHGGPGVSNKPGSTARAMQATWVQRLPVQGRGQLAGKLPPGLGMPTQRRAHGRRRGRPAHPRQH